MAQDSPSYFPPALVPYFLVLSPSLTALLFSLALGCSGVGWRVSCVASASLYNFARQTG